jgi:hypothetical protein
MNFDRVLTIDALGRCDRYNRALGELRVLQRRLDRLVRRTSLVQGSTLWGAHQYLSTLDATIASRQAQRMANGTISLDTLRDETAFWERYHEHFAHIVTRAENERGGVAPSREM